jgi:hypothetical protein
LKKRLLSISVFDFLHAKAVPHRMKNVIRSLFLVAICALGFIEARGAVVAQWTFNGAGSTNQTSYSANTPTTAGISSTTLATIGSASISQPSSGGTGSPAGGFLRFTGTESAINHSSFAFTLTLDASVTSASISSVSFNYDRFFNKSPTTVSWSYSILGGAQNVSLGSTALSGSGWQSGLDDFSANAISLGNGQTITITGTFNDPGNSSSSADIGFDNFSINGIITVPEPMDAALAAFGLIFVGGGVGRFYLRRAQRAVAA